MATTRVTPEKDAIVSEIVIAAPPERVFQALIDREQALQWGSSEEGVLTKWEMDPRVGGKWTFVARERSGSGKYPGDLIHHGEILEFDPPRVLEYTWFASWHSNPLQKTLVRWELSSATGGTRVKVTHSGLGAIPGACDGYYEGWRGVVTRIKQFVESNP